MTREEVKIMLGVDDSGVRAGLTNTTNIVHKSMSDTARSLTKLFAVNFTQLGIDVLRYWDDVTKKIANAWANIEAGVGRALDKNRRFWREQLVADRKAAQDKIAAEVEFRKEVEKTQKLEDELGRAYFEKHLAEKKTEAEKNQWIKDDIESRLELAKHELEVAERNKQSTNHEHRQAILLAQAKVLGLEKEMRAESARHAAAMENAAKEKEARLMGKAQTLSDVNALGPGAAQQLYDERMRRLQSWMGETRGTGDAMRYSLLEREIRSMRGMTPEQFVDKAAAKNIGLLQSLLESVQSGIKVKLPE